MSKSRRSDFDQDPLNLSEIVRKQLRGASTDILKFSLGPNYPTFGLELHFGNIYKEWEGIFDFYMFSQNIDILGSKLRQNPEWKIENPLLHLAVITKL